MGWYYLQSRYYDLVIHRFINADSYATTNAANAISCNMFVYCSNCPTKYTDSSGHAANPIYGVSAVCDNGSRLSVTIYRTELEAAAAFASKYYMLTRRYSREYAALIYNASYAGGTWYYCGRATVGTRDSVSFPYEGDGVDRKLQATSQAIAVVHMHPDMLHVDSTSFSSADISALDKYLPSGNMYLATLHCEIYMFDREKRSHDGLFMCTYIPNGLSGFFSEYKAKVDYLQ